MQWLDFFNDNYIEYTERGPNTKHGEVSIRCPWCGDDDPSQHLGISLSRDNWGCLRNPAHRGHSPSYLVAAIIGCTSIQAKAIVSQYNATDPDSILTPGALKVPTEKPAEVIDSKILRKIESSGPTAKFWRYLADRGFSDTKDLIDQYSLTCALTGRFKDRIIIPFIRGGELVAWTGRAIVNPANAPRYLSSNLVKTTLFNWDQLIGGGESLFVVEGPFDALKLDYYGQHYGGRAVPVLGVSLDVEQISLLNTLCRRFKRVVVLFDEGAIEPAFNATDWLLGSNVTLGHLPAGVKDPGELNPRQIQTLVRGLS